MMGTNYYLHTNVCGHCNRPKDVFHIGKSSMGWRFSLYCGDKHNEVPWEDWKSFKLILTKKQNQLYDEYEDKRNKREFITLVESKSDGLQHETHDESRVINRAVVDLCYYEFS